MNPPRESVGADAAGANSSKRPAAPVPGVTRRVYSLDNPDPASGTGCGFRWGYRHRALVVIERKIQEAIVAMDLAKSRAIASASPPTLFNRGTQVQESVSATSSEDSEAGAHPTV